METLGHETQNGPEPVQASEAIPAEQAAPIAVGGIVRLTREEGDRVWSGAAASAVKDGCL
ncbi:MAG TPA: hypothetical protein VLF59_04790 [Candidatus Saccharimonadales bacterium]|nr:hypothetical protein [Candidatus Saccharimonadales bacterium]